MDSLTHALAGVLICDVLPCAGRLGRKAPLAAAAVAVSPDLDLLPAFIANFPPTALSRAGFFAGDLVARFHRGVSHSLFLYALIFVPLAYLFWRWSGRRGPLRQWALLVLLCLLSHTFLDLGNRYGIRPWLPFSDARYALGIFSLFDIPLLIILGAVFVLNHVPRSNHARTSVAAVGMIGAALVTGRMLLALAMR